MFLTKSECEYLNKACVSNSNTWGKYTIAPAFHRRKSRVSDYIILTSSCTKWYIHLVLDVSQTLYCMCKRAFDISDYLNTRLLDSEVVHHNS